MMIRLLFHLLLSAPFLATGCQKNEPRVPVVPSTPNEMNISILCLGDSYTKGQSVAPSKNFPFQLRDSLLASGFNPATLTPRIIAQTGWRTDQLSSAITDATDIQDSIFSLVTLCIGVNNQYQHGTLHQYRTEFEALLQTAIQKSGGKKNRVVVISIPDWAFTPYGQSYPNGGAEITEEIDDFNAANKIIAEQYGVQYINVTEISRQGIARPDLVATDGLHPSAVQYSEWVRLILLAAKAALQP